MKFLKKFLTNILCRLWQWYCQESWPACLLPSFVFRWYKGLQSSHGPVSSCFNCISGTRERVSSYLYVLYPSFSYWTIYSAGWAFSFFSMLQLCSGTLGYLIPILSFFPFCTRHNYKGIYACTCLCVCAHSYACLCVLYCFFGDSTFLMVLYNNSSRCSFDHEVTVHELLELEPNIQCF